MKISTMKGMAAGGMLGMTLGAGLMMTQKGKRMKRVLSRDGAELTRRIIDCWTK